MVLALTGASGMLGRHILAALERTAGSARCSSRQPPVWPGKEHAWQPWDLSQWKTPDDLDALFPDVRAVIHAGAAVPSPARPVPPGDVLQVNVRASQCLGQWAAERGIPLIFFSSATVYAEPCAPALTENAARTEPDDTL